MAPRLKRFLDERAARYDVVTHPAAHSSRAVAAAADLDADRLAKGVLVESAARYLLERRGFPRAHERRAARALQQPRATAAPMSCAPVHTLI